MRAQLVLKFAICAALVAITWAVFGRTVGHEFVNFDDPNYVSENPQIHAGLNWQSIVWAFTHVHSANWHPLTWLSHALDIQLFGLNPAGHHLTSLVIHVVNVVLLFLLLLRATGSTKRSLLAAALFAVHPLNVESVAWVAERKNVLSTLFFLFTLGAYGWYVLKPNWERYLVTSGLFVLALAAKPMVITLPCLLLVLDFWPLHRIQGWTSRSDCFPLQQNSFQKLVHLKQLAEKHLLLLVDMIN